MTSPSPKCRRGLRFSLRTLLVAFTAVAVWLGLNVRLVQRRRDFIASLPAPASARKYWGEVSAAEKPFLMADDISAVFRLPHLGYDTVPYTVHEPTASGELSWIRRQLGDQSYCQITYYPGPSAEAARQLFPEARIMVADDPWGGWSEVGIPSR